MFPHAMDARQVMDSSNITVFREWHFRGYHVRLFKLSRFTFQCLGSERSNSFLIIKRHNLWWKEANLSTSSVAQGHLPEDTDSSDRRGQWQHLMLNNIFERTEKFLNSGTSPLKCVILYLHRRKMLQIRLEKLKDVCLPTVPLVMLRLGLQIL
jgi:hypothetical protein